VVGLVAAVELATFAAAPQIAIGADAHAAAAFYAPAEAQQTEGRRLAIINGRSRVLLVSMSAIDLYWLPLGAGGHSVRLNGLVFEAIAARLEHRGRADLFHSALEIHVPGGRFVIEQAPAWGTSGERGVVAEGAVGARAAGRFRLFRYEVRRWRDGVIPDAAEAVESPQRLSDDTERARWLLELVPAMPTPVWGRDELRTGEMWNSNSFISWLLVRASFDASAIQPPAGGRAPGWHAGVVFARRQLQEAIA
jgi:hypothetical protein